MHGGRGSWVGRSGLPRWTKKIRLARCLFQRVASPVPLPPSVIVKLWHFGHGSTHLGASGCAFCSAAAVARRQAESTAWLSVTGTAAALAGCAWGPSE